MTWYSHSWSLEGESSLENDNLALLSSIIREIRDKVCDLNDLIPLYAECDWVILCVDLTGPEGAQPKYYFWMCL